MVFLLPIEISHRELIAKLLISLRILSEKPDAQILIGTYDAIAVAARGLDCQLCLLDKSCSDQIFNHRAKAVIAKGGSVYVQDEEGINDLQSRAGVFLGRYDPRICINLTQYFCWSCIDEAFIREDVFPRAGKFSLAKTGSPRFELASAEGKRFWRRYSESLKLIYGEYVLISDNLHVENYDLTPRNPPPRRELLQSDYEYESQLVTYGRSQEARITRRQNLVDLVKVLSIKFPDISFIFRPHPCASSLHYNAEFHLHRNIHVAGHGSIEPWILGSKCMISCGCTSGLTSMLMGRPTFTFVDNLTTQDANNTDSLTERYSVKFNDAQKIVDFLTQSQKSKSPSCLEIDNGKTLTDSAYQDLCRDIGFVSESSPSRLIAEYMLSDYPATPARDDLELKIKSICKHIADSQLTPHPAYWVEYDITTIHRWAKELEVAYGISNEAQILVSSQAPGLYHLSGKA